MESWFGAKSDEFILLNHKLVIYFITSKEVFRGILTKRPFIFIIFSNLYIKYIKIKF